MYKLIVKINVTHPNELKCKRGKPALPSIIDLSANWKRMKDSNGYLILKMLLPYQKGEEKKKEEKNYYWLVHVHRFMTRAERFHWLL